MKNKTKPLVLCALFIGLICIATMILVVPIVVGYLNLGDAIIFMAGFILGPHYGFLAGALGASMADILLGFPQYAITSFVVKGIMGYVAGHVRQKDKGKQIKGCAMAGLIMVAGYYITDVAIQGNVLVPLGAVPFNILQFAVGIIIAQILCLSLKKYQI